MDIANLGYLARLFSKPSTQFWLLGTLLFIINSWFLAPDRVFATQYLDKERVEALVEEWRNIAGREPRADELDQLIQNELDQVILFNEALRRKMHLTDTVVQWRLLRDMRFMGLGHDLDDSELLQRAYELDLHLHDLVIKRRLVQLMESVISEPGEAVEPTANELVSLYEQLEEELSTPESYSLSHVFVSADRYGPQARAHALDTYAAVVRESLGVNDTRGLSDPFLSGYDFNQVTQAQLRRQFGPAFAEQVYQCKSGGWCEPIESVFGWHIVWLRARMPSQSPNLEDVRPKLVYQFRQEKSKEARTTRLASLREQYTLLTQSEHASATESLE